MMRPFRSAAHIAAIAAVAAALSIAAAVGWAAAFRSAAYDPQSDELVVTLAYRGTNPDHNFRLEWGECRRASGGSNEVAARILDDQWDERALRDFTKTVRFPLGELRCRPASVTLFSAPAFRIILNVPARGSTPRALRGPLTDAH